MGKALHFRKVFFRSHSGRLIIIQNQQQMKYTHVTVLLLISAMIGCGSGVGVSGKVTYSDGQPLTVGKVMFTDGTHTASGKLNSKGEYRLGMIKDGDGVPAGTYKIYITDALIDGDASLSKKDEDGNTFLPKVLAVAPKYTNPEKSGLTCTVQGSTKQDFTVEKPGADYKPLPTLED